MSPLEPIPISEGLICTPSQAKSAPNRQLLPTSLTFPFNTPNSRPAMLATPTIQPKPLKPRHLRFAIALAQGATQAQAFRIAAGHEVAEETCKSQGWQWANREEIKAKVRELQDAADEQCTMRLIEARKLLAETARTAPRADPTHTDRIAAIKADAELAGWTKQDGPVVTINFATALNQVRQTFAPTLDLDSPPPPALPTPPDATGGAPNPTSGLAAMGGNPQHEQSGPFFTIDSPFTQEQFQIPQNPVEGVFYNELGEEEETG